MPPVLLVTLLTTASCDDGTDPGSTCRWTTGGGQNPLADGSMVVASVVYAGIIGSRRCPIPTESQPPAVIGRFFPATGLTSPTAFRRLEDGTRWRVVDRDGLPIAELRTPEGFFLLEVGDDHVLGVHKDESHRESVRLYRLVR